MTTYVRRSRIDQRGQSDYEDGRGRFKDVQSCQEMDVQALELENVMHSLRSVGRILPTVTTSTMSTYVCTGIIAGNPNAQSLELPGIVSVHSDRRHNIIVIVGLCISG